jgi:hypothetical protein
MKKLLLLLCLVPLSVMAKNRKVSLSDAVKEADIALKATNTNGHYKGKTTRLALTNNTKDVLTITVNPGVILRPEDTTNQPMVLAGGETMVMLPHTERMIEVGTFCGNAPKSCPSENDKYVFSHLGSDTLVQLLEFLHTNRVELEAAQSAVWVITNKHKLSNVYADNPVVQKKLMEFLSKITGQPLPEYYTLTAQREQAGEAAHEPKALKILAEFTVLLDAPKVLTLGVYNDKGEMIQKVFENKEFPRMGHKFGVEFESADVAEGKYYIRLKERETVLQEKMVEVR